MRTVSLIGLALSLVPIGLVGYLLSRWGGSGWKIFEATARMLVQLLAVGYVLRVVLDNSDIRVGLAVMSVMVVAAGLISVRTVDVNRRNAIVLAIVSIMIGGGAALACATMMSLGLGFQYDPRIVIPLAGMTFSNAMTAVTLVSERLQRELETGVAYPEARNAAFQAGLIPQVNTFLAVGIVSLPGMMSGQILSGVDPLVAVRYQIVVMSLILQSAAFSTAIFLIIGHRFSVFAPMRR